VFDERLIMVSGKGGVGKTAVASAIADVSARVRPTVLVTFDGQQQRHPFFDVPLSYEPVEAGANLWVQRVDGLSAVREYVRRKVPFSGLYDTLLTSRMFRDFAEAAPGFEELMCLGKLYDLVTESRFAQVVFDAPSTGHLKTLVDVPAATLKAVLVGPLNHNARKIQDLLVDPERTRMVLVALAEEMAVREALELSEFCRERRMGVGPFIINQRVMERFTAEEIRTMEALENPSAELRAGIDAATAEFGLAASQLRAIAPLGTGGSQAWTIPRCIDHEPAALLAEISAALNPLSTGADGVG
jgi:anion-transporting  ArsA/GET3 family ATPase